MSKQRISGIYAIVNKVNSKMYIGSSKSVYYRWKQQHVPDLRKCIHSNHHLQNAWNKYGENSFEFKVLEECEESLLVEREGHWIEQHKSWDRQHGYNLARYVEGRMVVSEETLAKMRDYMKERWQSIKENDYQGMNLGFIEFKLTPEKQERITQLRKQGLPWEEIFKQEGVSRTHFYRAMKIKDGKYGGNAKNRETYVTVTDEVKKIAIELRQEGKSWKEIGKQLGVDRTTFYRHGLNVGNEEKVRKQLTPERRQQILDLRRQGKKWDEIAATVGISIGTICFHKLHKE